MAASAKKHPGGEFLAEMLILLVMLKKGIKLKSRAKPPYPQLIFMN